MAKQTMKSKDGKNFYRKGDMWISPSFSLKRPMRHSDWDHVRVKTDESNKFLELADIALSLICPRRNGLHKTSEERCKSQEMRTGCDL